MAGKKQKVEPRSRDLRFDNQYLSELATDLDLFREWMREEALTITQAARHVGVSRTTLDKILNEGPDWSKRTMAPKRSTTFLMEQAAGIKTKKWRPKPKKRKRTENYPLRQPKLPRRRR
jgi:DNA-binding XRE family transcriptional regulator